MYVRALRKASTVRRFTITHLQSEGWDVRDEHVVRVLKILRDRSRGPFLVHCQHGADRTGLMMAMYRMVEQGWSREDAMREMTQGGYGFHKTWRNIVRYVQRVDVDKIRAGLVANQ